MSEELVQLVQNKLKEDTWTRVGISNYTKNNLIELTEIVEKARESGQTDEVKAICDELLSHTRDSITALYISGMLGLKKGSLDNSNLEELVDIFSNNHKQDVVVYMCETILSDDASNMFALRTLAKSYEDGDKKWEIFEKIVKLDFSEAEIAKKLAAHYDEIGDTDKANDFYKKALLRFINTNKPNSVSEMWSKLIERVPDDFDFFMLAERKISSLIGNTKSTDLLSELYTKHYKPAEKWDTSIEIIKTILTMDPSYSWARRELAECYARKYANQPNVQEYIRDSNLTSNFRNVFEAINDFEKHIAFDVKNFVFHRTWGVGVIKKVENDTLTINFGKKNGVRDISLKMAVNALQPLAKDHIWVLKATNKKEDLAKKVKDDHIWALKTIIKSFGNSCDFKKIKAELVPSILTAGEWTSWNAKAKKTLQSLQEEDSSFGVNPNNINEYTVREGKISPEEKLSNEFRAQKQFYPKIDILMKFVEDDSTDKESELFATMFSYFANYLKSFNAVNDQVVASYLVVTDLTNRFQNLAFQPKFTFAELYDEIDSPKEMYLSFKDSKNTSLRDDFLEKIKLLPNWVDEYIKLFPTALKINMITSLINSGHEKEVHKLVATAFGDFRGYRDAILFFFEKCSDEDWFKNANVPLQKQLIAIVNIIAHCYREIDNHLDSTENKKIIKNATKMLFDKDTSVYANYMMSCDKENTLHMYRIVNDIVEFDSDVKSRLRNKILEKYPDVQFTQDSKNEKNSNKPKGMLVTAQKLSEKRALEEKMQNEDLPKIAQEVAWAKEKGDLKENAEYIAAKEAQHKLSVDLKRLQEELGRATVFDPTTATASFISFGTEVNLLNKDSGKEEKYTILGPWESDPENGVISYMSPFGNALLDRKVGEEFSFKIGDNKTSYEVKEIKITKF
ncbi:MAG: transcription elongation factor GreA [Treponema sp.]|nr:transcription elongation factor GreA [Treponema sp.]